MNNPSDKPHATHKHARLLFFTVFNLLNLVLVGRGMILLSMGEFAGYFWVPLGTLGVLVLTWLQESHRVIFADWNKTWLFSVVIGIVAVGTYIRMLVPYF